MPKISFTKDFPPITVSRGETLMKALLNAGRPVASSCHGDGICSKCRMTIVDGLNNLSRYTDLEKQLRDQHKLEKKIRISCQTQVLGDITIDTPYW